MLLYEMKSQCSVQPLIIKKFKYEKIFIDMEELLTHSEISKQLSSVLTGNGFRF